ncbi:hypothetical protein ACFC9J_16370 [Enterococcus casseliflavus]|uniref:hypothetical protein n=1 Tax=Enterococcus casseliflavus TaxID=37734 RepID=UPI0039A4FDE8
MREEFKKQYIEKVLNGSGFDDELNRLFESILLNEMNDDPEKMSEFIQSIIDENTEKEPSELDLLKQENNEMKQRQEMTEEALLALSDMLLSR